VIERDLTFFSQKTCDAATVGTDTIFLKNKAGCDSLVVTERVFDAVGCAPSSGCPTGKEGNLWLFGDHAGLDFSIGFPVITTSQMDSYEASTIVCDDNGQLLFYSDGEQVWNKNHELMPAVNSPAKKLFGSVSAMQIIAVPQPANSSLFYLFYMETSDFFNAGTLQDTTRRMYYATIDMTLQNGLGDVVEKTKYYLKKRAKKWLRYSIAMAKTGGF
jgi:hypothetical protein